MAQRSPVVLLTGASKGLGLAIAAILLRQHAKLVTLSRTATPELRDLAKAYPEALLVLEADVSKEDSVKYAVDEALAKWPHIDSLILNAGVLDPLARIGSASTDVQAWRDHFDVNFFSLITTLQATLPFLRASELGGKVVFVSSGAAVGGTSGWGAYNAGKAAMNSLCRTLAQEEPTITSVAVRPGKVDTSMQKVIRDAGVSSEGMPESVHSVFMRAHADGELVKPEEPGHVLATLALRATSDLNGQFVSWDSDACKAYRS